MNLALLSYSDLLLFCVYDVTRFLVVDWRKSLFQWRCSCCVCSCAFSSLSRWCHAGLLPRVSFLLLFAVTGDWTFYRMLSDLPYYISWDNVSVYV